jgi:hypothetical protein
MTENAAVSVVLDDDLHVLRTGARGICVETVLAILLQNPESVVVI